MPIEFLCPNGHRIVCGDDRAGKGAKCPKCGATFRIPGGNGAVSASVDVTAQAAVQGALPGTASEAMPADSGELAPPEESLAPSPEQPAASGGDDMIVFLCPNGHRLNGPTRLQGKAGQCPHCGERFRIPVLDEMEEVEELSIEDVAGDEDGALHELFEAVKHEVDEDHHGSRVGQTTQRPGPHDDDLLPPPPPVMHPLCKLLRKLWEEKEHGGVIELHLDGGTMLVPDWFDDRLSHDTHGLFAAQAADGTVTMTAVSWEKIARVIVRGVEGLPEGMFE